LRHFAGRPDRAEVLELELDEAAEPGPDGDDRVDPPGVGHGISMIAAAEGHRIERETTDRHLATQVVAVGADLTDVEHPHVPHEQPRTGVPRAARLEVGQLQRETRGEPLGRDLGIDADRRHGAHAAEAGAHGPVEPLGELGYPIHRDREPRCHGVSPMAQKDVVAVVEGLGDVNAGNRATRALAFETVDGDDRRGASVIVHEPGRAEADDARGPRGIGDHRRPRVGPLLGTLARAGHDDPGQLLPLGVALLEPLGERLRLGRILREQQAERVFGVVDPTRGVETRTENESDLGGTDAAELEAAAIDERANADQRHSVQRVQSRPCQDAIRAAERDDIGDGRQRGELQQIASLFCVGLRAEQPLRELERDARAGEILVDRGIARPPRVHQSEGLGEVRGRMVVVRHDEIDAQVAGEERLVHRGHAAVDRDDHLRTVRRQVPQRRGVDAVALLVAVWDVRRDARAEPAESADEDGGTGDAIDVIVAVDDDALATRERTTQTLDSPLEVSHRRPRVGGPGGEEVGHFRDRDATAREDLSHERGDTIGRIRGLRGHDPKTLRSQGHVNVKYLARLFTAAAFLCSCAPSSVANSPSPTALPPTARVATPSPSGLAVAPHAIFGPIRQWYLLPDSLFHEDVHIAVTFPDADPAEGLPRARLRGNGRVVDLHPTPGIPGSWQAELPLDGARAGSQRVEILVRLHDGTDASIAARDFVLSAPEYVVWTLDFEGDAAGDPELANTAAIAASFKVPMTIMWNPRVWTTTQVTPERAQAMQRWMTGLSDQGMGEIALHLHMWTDFVRAAGLVPRTAPNWAGRSDGYDVPLTAFTEDETRTLLDYSLKLMADHGLPRPTSFRAGGEFASAANLRAVAAAGFTADCSAVPAGAFGRLPYPWTLPADAQPYRPSPDDANAPGSLPLLEAPTIGGNTYAYDVSTIRPIIRADLSFLAPAGEPASMPRTITIVSHPGTIVATERAAIESLFAAFAPLRYDRDIGPLRFVTLAQLAKAYP
jgi:hypothetical protein